MRGLIAICFMAWASSAMAAEQQLVCHESSRYLIVEGPVDKAPGQFLVKHKNKNKPAPSCDYQLSKGDFEIYHDEYDYFVAIQGDFLILDGGTSLELRDLMIWNLEQQKMVYQTSYSSVSVEPGYVEYWLETGWATDENCPQKKEWDAIGLGSAIETRVRLSLADLSLTTTTDTRCSERQ